MQTDKFTALQWWADEDPHEDLIVAFRDLETADSTRRADYMRYIRLYGNRDFYGYTPFTHDRVYAAERSTLNVVKSVCDTAVSRLSRSQPRPRFITHGGNWSLKRRARNLEKFVSHAFYAARFNMLAPKILMDAAVMGTGVMKVFRHGQEITFERVFPGEVFVNQADGFYGEPRTFYQRKFIDREVLLDMFPQYANQIRNADRTTNDMDYGVDSLVDQIEVVEGWHLPSGPDTNDGRHCIVITNATLYDEPWEKGYFPFVFVRWTDRLLGFWGMGIAEDIMGIQLEINRLMIRINKALHLMAVPRIYVENNSKVRKSFFNNDVGTIIPYTGTPPQIAAPPVLPREVFDHLEMLYARAFEIAGITQMAATGRKPSGLDSGVALREYQDIESLRFTTVSRQYEQMYIEAAKQVVDLGKDIYAEDNEYSVVLSKDKNTIEAVDFSEVDMEADDYVLQVHPSSSLPVTPAGRLAFVEQMISLNLLGPDEAKRLLDFPDLEAQLSLDRAASMLIDRNIEFMLDDGRYMPPPPYQDHTLALKKVQAALQNAEQNGVPEDRLDLLRQYLVSTHQMMQRAQMQQMAMAQGAMVPGAPPAPGAGGASPTAVGPTDGNIVM